MPYDSATSFLGIEPEESKLMYYGDLYTAVIITVLLTVAKLWSQPRNEAVLLEGKWRQLEIIV